MLDEKLKIAMLSIHSCPVGELGTRDTGGMSVYVLELARELGKRGHLVDVYTRAHNSEHEPVTGIGENARLIHLKAGENEPLNKLAIYPCLPDFACELENFRKLNNVRYDLVFSHYWLSAWVGNIVQGWWSVPHMAMFHTLGAIKNALGIGEDEPELRVEMERYLINQSHRVIVATEQEKQDIIRYYGASPESIGIVPCGVNLELFRPVDKRAAKWRLGFGNNGKIILYVGRVEPLKGIDRLLEAMSYLKNRQGIKLVIVGGDNDSRDEVEQLKEMSLRLGIQDSITFLGLMEQEELPRFYSAADVCVVPSYYESFGLVPLESLACGTPVVMTGVGSARTVIRDGETGYVVPDNRPELLTEKIELLLSRPEADTNFINSVRASVTGFSWSHVADGILGECRILKSMTRQNSLV